MNFPSSFSHSRRQFRKISVRKMNFLGLWREHFSATGTVWSGAFRYGERDFSPGLVTVLMDANTSRPGITSSHANVSSLIWWHPWFLLKFIENGPWLLCPEIKCPLTILLNFQKCINMVLIKISLIKIAWDFFEEKIKLDQNTPWSKHTGKKTIRIFRMVREDKDDFW